MIPLSAIFLLLSAAAQDPAQSDRSTVDKWITDLGSSDEQIRTRAETELKKMGKSAVPALREAAKSDDAERAMRARRLLVGIVHEERGKEQQHQASPSPRVAMVYEDWLQGIRFALAPNGKVTLTVPEKADGAERREYKTYQADSIDDFKKKYPEIARRYEIDKFMSLPEVPPGDEQLREWLGLQDDDHQGAGEEPAGRRFGVLVTPTGPALASQLRLREGEGLVVRRVQPRSLAEKSGVRRWDVIVAINGEKVQARQFEEFRKRLQEAAGSKEFTLEVLRGGKTEKILVKPATGEKEEKQPKAK